MLDRLLRSFFRPFAFYWKEFIQVRRQPRLILMLILGPFTVLLLFGLGYSSETQPIETVLVLPDDPRLPTQVSAYQEEFIPPFELIGVTDDREEALERLTSTGLDAVVVFPDNAVETIESGQQATIEVLYDELDPLQRSWLEYYAYVQTNALNRSLLTQALEEQRVGAAGPVPPAIGFSQLFRDAASIPSGVVVSPFRSEGTNIAPSTPDYVGYYAPGVLALLVQHIAVTFTALALVRERLRGALELFRVGPVSSSEILGGKYLSYFVQTALIAALLTVVMNLALDIPFLGSLPNFMLALLLLIAASLGLGFMISALSASETQAVQLSLLVLLASVFFSGFLLPLENLLTPVLVVSYSLPVTYGIQSLQSVMLRGISPDAWLLWALVGMTAAFVLVSAIAFRFSFRRK